MKVFNNIISSNHLMYYLSLQYIQNKTQWIFLQSAAAATHSTQMLLQRELKRGL